MTPTIGPKRARTGWKPLRAHEPPKTATDLRKRCYGRFLAMTMRCTWFVPS